MGLSAWFRGTEKTPCAVSEAVTYLELVATCAILLILASAILPVARVGVQRQREIELRRALREVRLAIDRYKAYVDMGQIGGTDVKLGSEGYPPDLETLVKGVNRVGASTGRSSSCAGSRWIR